MARGAAILVGVPPAGEEAALEHRHAEQHEAQRFERGHGEAPQPVARQAGEFVPQDRQEVAAIEGDFLADGGAARIGQGGDEAREALRIARRVAPGIEAGDEAGDQQEMQQEEQEGGLDQRQRLALGEEQGDQADQRIEHQYVAPPEQQIVSDADREEPAGAHQLGAGAIAPRHFLPIDQQQHRGAEQHGEQTAHLAIDQDQAGGPECDVPARQRTGGRRVGIGALRQGEGGDVHPEDAHDRAAAQNVHGGDAGGGRHGQRVLGNMGCSPLVSGARLCQGA